MAKKQTRRSISVSRTTYERLKAFCETNHISMSQLVETRVNDFLGPNEMRPDTNPAGVVSAASMASPSAMHHAAVAAPRPVLAAPSASTQPAAMASFGSRAPLPPSRPLEARPAAPVGAATSPGVAATGAAAPAAAAPAQPPMTSAAARFAVDPPPPIIKPRQETAAPKPAEKRPDQIFTF